jgi:hypothetical protein
MVNFRRKRGPDGAGNKPGFFLSGLVLAVFWASAVPCSGFDWGISGAELDLGFRGEHNRNMYFSWDLAASGFVELNGFLGFGAGLAAGQIWDIATVDAYAFAEAAPPFFRPYAPLTVGLAYIYNGLPAYETYAHTLLPQAGLDWRYLGGRLGLTLRYTRFGGSQVLAERILAYSAYLNFYHTEEAEVGIRVANFGNFFSNNLGSYFYAFYNRFRLNRRIGLLNELRIDLSGTSAYPTSIYGMSFRGGVIIIW